MRKKIPIPFLLAILTGAALLPACGGGDDPAAPTDPGNLTGDGYTLNAGVTLIPPADSAVIQAYDPDTGALTLADASGIQAGDVVLGQNAESAPSGFLRRVTGKAGTGTDAVLQTEPATLTAAFRALSLSDTVRLRTADLEATHLDHGAVLSTGADGYTFTLDLDCVFHDPDGGGANPGNDIRLTGTYDFTAAVHAAVAIETSVLSVFRTALLTEKDADLGIQVGSSANLDGELSFRVAELTFAPVSFLDVLWLVPTLRVNAHLGGDLGVTFTAGLTFTETATVGYATEAGDTFLLRESAQDFGFDPPVLLEEFDFEVGVDLDASCRLYGLPGPVYDTRSVLDFTAAFSPDPCRPDLDLTVDGTVDAGVSLFCPAVAQDFSRNFQLYDQRLGLWSFNVSGHGDLRVEVAPAEIQPPWRVTGPCDFSREGTGDALLTDLLPGDYEVCWLHVPGYEESPCETLALSTGQTVVVSGVYREESGPSGRYIPIPPETVDLPVTFTMGSPVEADETPHDVTITRRFLMAEAEVTRGVFLETLQWAYDQQLVTVTDSLVLDALDGSTAILVRLDPVGGDFSFADGMFSTQNVDHPAGEVSWYGAAAYCDWLSLRAGLPRAYDHATWQCNNGDPYGAVGYRLPTEAEWELACRAGTTTHFNTGNCLNSLTEANYNGWEPFDGCQWGPNEGATVEVGRFPANDWGLFGMHGNMWEWCNDWYGPYPGIVEDPTGSAGGHLRVMRGGYWNYNGSGCRSAKRDWADPELEYDDYGGVRPVKVFEGSKPTD